MEGPLSPPQVPEADLFDSSEDEKKTSKKKSEDVFGSDSEDEQSAGESKPQNEEQTQSSLKEEPEEPEELEELEEQAPQGPPMILEYYELPKPQDAQLVYVRIPNILGIEPKPFQPSNYESLTLEGEEGSRKLLNPETVIRWRTTVDSDGTVKQESNARFVKWSDGSLQLFVGNEGYDVTQQDISQDNNYLFVKQTQLHKCHGKLDSKLIFRPTSLGSKTHQKLTETIVQRHRKNKKIKLVTIEKDPEKEKDDQDKAEEGRIKASLKLEAAKQKKKKSYEELNAQVLEEGYSEEIEENYEYNETDEGNIAAIKARFGKKSKKDMPRKKSRQEEEEAEQRILKAKKDESLKNPETKPAEEEEIDISGEEEIVPVIKGRKRVIIDD